MGKAFQKLEFLLCLNGSADIAVIYGFAFISQSSLGKRRKCTPDIE